MYDTEEPVLRRVLAIILWAVVIVAVVWAVIWFVFFRGHSQPANNGGLTHKGTTSQNNQNKSQGQKPQSPTQPSTSSGSSSSSQTANNAGSSLQSGGSSAAQGPTQLANTGAGDIFAPFALATVAGSTVYYIRLRRKLTQ